MLRGSLMLTQSAARAIRTDCYSRVVAIGFCAPQSFTVFGLAQPKLMKITRPADPLSG
jgi:hypothetical protein